MEEVKVKLEYQESGETITSKKRKLRETDKIRRTFIVLIVDANQEHVQILKLLRVTQSDVQETISSMFFNHKQVQSAFCVEPSEPSSTDILGTWFWVKSGEDVMFNTTCRAWQQNQDLKMRGRCVLVGSIGAREKTNPKSSLTSDMIFKIVSFHQTKGIKSESQQQHPKPEKKKRSGANCYVLFNKRDKTELPNREWASLSSDEKSVYEERAKLLKLEKK